jgi:hypothetical protein
MTGYELTSLKSTHMFPASQYCSFLPRSLISHPNSYFNTMMDIAYSIVHLSACNDCIRNMFFLHHMGRWDNKHSPEDCNSRSCSKGKSGGSICQK